MAPPSPVIGFPYGSTGLLIDNAPWLQEGSDDSPVMTTGPDAAPDWIAAPVTASGSFVDAVRPITPPAISTDFTLEFDLHYNATTSTLHTSVSLMLSDMATEVLTLAIATSAGAATGSMSDSSGSTGALTISFSLGSTHHVKATYDGTNVRLYVDGVIQITWPRVLVNSPSLIASASVLFDWDDVHGSRQFMKDMTLNPGVL